MFICLLVFKTEINFMTFPTEPKKKLFLFVTSSTKLYFQELYLNALKCSLHLVLNVLLGWPTYFVEQSGNFFWYTPFFNFFLFSCFRKLIPENCLSFKSDVPIPVAARYKAWVCGHSLAGIAGSNPTDDIDVCLSWVLCVVYCQVEVSAKDWSLIQRSVLFWRFVRF